MSAAELRKSINLVERAAAGYSDNFLYWMWRHTSAVGYRQMSPDSQRDFARAFAVEAPALDKPVTAYRGICLESWDELAPAENFLERDVLEFADFLPTSLIRNFGLLMTSYRFGKSARVLFEITVNPGVQAVHVPDLADIESKYYFSKREQELILDRGLKFQVADRRQGTLPFYDSTELDPDSWEVRLEQVQ